MKQKEDSKKLKVNWMKPIVEVQFVEKSYKESQVLKNCSFRMFKGEIYGLLGVNGAGKTTLMKLLLGLQRADCGTIYVLGQDVSSSTAYLSEVGSVIEAPVFYEHLHAYDMLAMHLALMQKQADIAKTLCMVGLDGVGNKPISQYSLGMRQRLGIARAIIHHPRLLVLDEPLNGLDPVAITQLRELMRKLADMGMSILLSSHIIGEIRHTADRIGILSGGCIQQEFSVAEKVLEYGEKFEEYVVGFMRSEKKEACILG